MVILPVSFVLNWLLICCENCVVQFVRILVNIAEKNSRKQEVQFKISDIIIQLRSVSFKGEVSRKFAVISKPQNVCLSAETMK